MKKTRVAIVGCGRITQVRHAPEYAENPNCEIIGFYDLMPERAAALAGEYGGQAFSSLEELIAAGPDAASVCNANIAHAETSVRLLDAGVHVLCEKPMAMTPEDCRAMCQAAEKNGKVLMLGHNQRLNKAHIRAREIISSGEMGRPLTFRTTFAHAGTAVWTGQKNSWFTDRRLAVFGAMADLGVHKIDVIHMLLGEKIAQVSALTGTLNNFTEAGAPISVEDNAILLCRTRSGVLGTVKASWTHYGAEDNSTRVDLTGGVIRLYEDPDASLILERADGSVERTNPDKMTTNDQQTAGKRASTGIIDAFVDSVRAGKRPPIDGKEAMSALMVVFAAARAAREGRTVDVEA